MKKCSFSRFQALPYGPAATRLPFGDGFRYAPETAAGPVVC